MDDHGDINPDYSTAGTALRDLWRFEPVSAQLESASTNHARLHQQFLEFIDKQLAGEKAESKAAPPKVFISYAWAIDESNVGDMTNQLLAEKVASDLRSAGFHVFFDKWEDRVQDSLTEFMQHMPESDFLILLGTPLYVAKSVRRSEGDSGDHVVRFEEEFMSYVTLHSLSSSRKVVPIVLEGNRETGIPALLQGRAKLHFTEGNDYFRALLRLVMDLYGLEHIEKTRLEAEWRRLASQSVAVPVSATSSAAPLSPPREAFPSGRAQAEGLRTPPRQTLLDVLAHGIPAGSVTPPSPTTGLRVPSNLPAKNPYFTNRNEALQSLGERMQAEGCIQAVCGMPGVGKTSLLLELVHRQVKSDPRYFRYIRWMVMEPNKVQTSWRQFAADLKIETEGVELKEVVAKVYEHLSQVNYLLVFDNVGKFPQIASVLPADLRAGQCVLISSRDQASWQNPIVVEKFSNNDAADYVRAYFISADMADAFDADLVSELNQKLGGLPLGLALAMSYLRDRRINLEELLTRLNDGVQPLLAQPKQEQGVDIPHTLDTLWEMSLEKLSEDHPASLALLRAVSRLAADRIPRSLLKGICEELPPDLPGRQVVISPLDDEELDARLQPLLDSSLLTTNGNLSRFSIHRLLQGMLRWRESGGRAADGLSPLPFGSGGRSSSDVAAIVKAIRGIFPGSVAERSDFILIGDLAMHCQAALDFLGDDEPDAGTPPLLPEEETFQLKAELNYWLARCWYYQSDYPRAVGHAEQSVRWYARLDRAANAGVVGPLYELGVIHLRMNQPQKAEQYLSDLASIRGVFDLPLDYHAALLLNRGRCHAGQARYDEAITCCEQAVKIYERSSPSSPSLAAALHNLGAMHAEKGNAAEATRCYTRALAIYQEKYPGHSSQIGVVMHNLSIEVQRASSEEASLPLRAQALELCRRVYPEEHPRIQEIVRRKRVWGISPHRNMMRDIRRVHSDISHLPCVIELVSGGNEEDSPGDRTSFSGLFGTPHPDLDEVLASIMEGGGGVGQPAAEESIHAALMPSAGGENYRPLLRRGEPVPREPSPLLGKMLDSVRRADPFGAKPAEGDAEGSAAGQKQKQGDDESDDTSCAIS